MNPSNAEPSGTHPRAELEGSNRKCLAVVAIGCSGANSTALEALFAAMPADPGMAFVVVVPLPDVKARELAAKLSRCGPLPVRHAAHRAALTAGEAQVVSTDHAWQVRDGTLDFDGLTPERERSVALDLFLRTLAEGYGSNATAIVLAGDGNDGLGGIRRIKEHGGLTIAQDPQEVQFSGMPLAAVATGLVDWVLPVAEMAPRLMEYRRIEPLLRLPAAEAPSTTGPPDASAADEAALREVLAFLRMRTGRDFSTYKRATTVRRIARRMQVNGMADLPAYLDLLRTRPGEPGALLQDLLISVTGFFRDPRSFEALEKQIGALFSKRSGSDRMRAWVAACATGEEAYSIAMLLAEQAGTRDTPPAIQVFATDLDEQAIRFARAGLYPATIEADISPQRLQRFFLRENDGYRIRRELRETVLFSLHDLLRDSAFSRLDLVSCRNLMIYLTREAQNRVRETFHFSLRTDGRLFLGSSESIDDNDPLFETLDKKHRIYARRPIARTALAMPVPHGPNTLTMWIDAQVRPHQGAAIPGRMHEPPAPWRQPRASDQSSWAELHLHVLERIAPPSLIVDARHEIVHLSESAGRFLQLGAGEPSTNLLRLVDAAVRVELRAALERAAQPDAQPGHARVRMEQDGATRNFTIRVEPVRDFGATYMLVVFQPEDEATAPAREPHATDLPVAPVQLQLEREIDRLNARLRETVEEHEASTEELKSSNEELQAMNEELRSATEELETGREELQSINEELSTVNLELKVKVDELGGSNSDMLNLMDATAIPTVFLDRELRISRYTPAAVDVFNLIPTDIGRPLTDLRTQLDFPTFAEDAARVLEHLVPVEREIDRDGETWYAVRLLPYRTLDDHIAGIVLTLLDITTRRATEMALRASEERLRMVVENARDYAIFSVDLDRRVTSWNAGAERLLGYREAEVLGLSADLIFTPEDIAAGVPTGEVETALATGRAADDRFHQRKDGTRFWASGSMMPMHDGANEMVGLVKILRDQTEARDAHQALERSRAELLQAWRDTEAAHRESELQKEHLRALFTQAPAPICILRGRDYRVEFANAHMCLLWRKNADAVRDRPVFEAVPGLRHTSVREVLDELMRSGVPQVGKQVPAVLDRDGSGSLEKVYLNFNYAPLRGTDGLIDGVLVIAFDVSDEIRAREQMSALHEAAESASRAKDDFLAMLGHELRNPLAPLRNSLQLMRLNSPVPKDAALLDVADRQAGNLTRIVDDLLEAARITQGKIELRIDRLDFADAVRQAFATARDFIASHRHHTELDLPDQALWVDADPMRVEQVVVNLLHNAAKYTPAGGRIRIELRTVADMAELRVVDNGIGIAEDLRPRLFQLFQQGPRQLSRKEGGLGVGLSVVRRLVELHGGGVEVASEGIGEGSTFIVRLPLARSDGAGAAERRGQLHAEQDAADAAPTAGLRILVVDDNHDAGDTLLMLAESLGHEARLVGGGLAGLELCAAWRPDVIFLDIGLPDMDGYAVATEIRARQDGGPRPRLVAVTGYGQDKDRARTREAGFDDHLVKPASFEAITEILQAVAAGRAVDAR